MKNLQTTLYLSLRLTMLAGGFVLLIALVTMLVGRVDSAESDASTQRMQAFSQDRATIPQTRQPALAAVPCDSNGMAGIYPCKDIDLQAFVPFSSLGGGSAEASDIWGWTHSASGREFALMGRSDGTVFVEITTSTAPIYLGRLPAHTVNSIWRDIKVYADHAFIVSEASNHGMQIFDLTQLLSVTTPQTFSNTAHFSGFGNAHNVVINEHTGHAFGVGATTCSGGLHIVDVSTPATPVSVGCFSADGYTHDAQCVRYNGPDLDHIGKPICFNSNEDTLTIVDLSDPTAPVQLSRIGYAGSRYTHQSWLTEDQRHVFIGDELDERDNGVNTTTLIADVADLDAPVFRPSYVASLAAIDHNLYVKGHSVYQANYRAGLRILDSSTPTSLNEIGYFDVYPSSNSDQFNGAWSNYPYFDSDVIIVSHIEQGLFVLEPNATLKASAADFVIEPTEVVLTLPCSSSDTTTFYLDDVYGFNSSVTLSVAGLPTGVSSAFSATSVVPSAAPGTPSTLTLTSGNNQPMGTHLLTVTATGGGVTHTEYLRLELTQNCVPTAVTLSSNGTAASTITWWMALTTLMLIALSWSAIQRAATMPKGH